MIIDEADAWELIDQGEEVHILTIWFDTQENPETYYIKGSQGFRAQQYGVLIHRAEHEGYVLIPWRHITTVDHQIKNCKCEQEQTENDDDDPVAAVKNLLRGNFPNMIVAVEDEREPHIAGGYM